MSVEVNMELFERAADMIDYWSGTIIAACIENDLAENDLDGLYAHVCEAEGMASQEEFEYADIA